MYPSIPLKLVNESVKNSWSEIEGHTKIPQSEFLSGLEFMVNMTYFSFNNKFYKQIDSLPLGDPCSPILGDLVFYDLEKRVLDSFDFEIPFYGRYVDDAFLIVFFFVACEQGRHVWDCTALQSKPYNPTDA